MAFTACARLVGTEEAAGQHETGLVSVIIPHFNSTDTIEEAIESVRSQTYSRWEIILVDDGSSDPIHRLRELAADDPRIQLIELGSNSGTPAVPRNIGLDRAGGEFIAFLDADDVWHPQKLEIQMTFLRDKQGGLCFCEVCPFRQGVGRAGFMEFQFQFHDGKVPHRVMSHKALLRKNVIRSGSTVLLTNSAKGVERFDEDPQLRAVEDYSFWLQLHQSRVLYSYWLHVPLVAYRLSDRSISRSKLYMARQHLHLYRHYRVNGRGLGLRAYLYFFSYAVMSIVYLVRTGLRCSRWSRAMGLTSQPDG